MRFAVTVGKVPQSAARSHFVRRVEQTQLRRAFAIIEIHPMATHLQIVSPEFAGHMGEYAGAQTPADFGEVRREYVALRKACGVYLLNWRAKIGLRGTDRVRWLNGMITNNVRDLAAGHGVYSFLLNAQGRILGDLNAYNDGDMLIVDTDQSQREKIVATFDHFIIMDDVEIVDLNTQFSAIGVAGPNSQEIMQKIGVPVPELEPLQFTNIDFRGTAIKLVRTGDSAQHAYELWMKPEYEGAVWHALAETGAIPVGSTALELDRIARGIPRYGVDLRERDLPQETEQYRALNFNKGCYVGQEIVERIRSRGNVHRTFTGFLVDGGVPAIGTKIEAQGKEVGEITSAAALPVGGRDAVVALGYIRREAIAIQRDVMIGGSLAQATNLPFSDLLAG
jgi:folate-binding protein YgfZ